MNDVKRIASMAEWIAYAESYEDNFIKYLTNDEYRAYEAKLKKHHLAISIINEKYNNIVSERMSPGATKIPGLITKIKS